MAYTKLPADLPENWQIGQIVSPSGVDVGLTTQHGYNYLMNAVNAAQKQANILSAATEELENNYNTVTEKTTMLTGTTDPTESTVGLVGQMYYDTTNTALYVCTTSDVVTGKYTWELVGENITVGEDIPNDSFVGNVGEFYLYKGYGSSILFCCTEVDKENAKYTWAELNTPIKYASYAPSEETPGTLAQIWVDITTKGLYLCQGSSLTTDDDGNSVTTYNWIEIATNSNNTASNIPPIGALVYFTSDTTPQKEYGAGGWVALNETTFTVEEASSNIVYVTTADEFREAVTCTTSGEGASKIIVLANDIDFANTRVIPTTYANWYTTYASNASGLTFRGNGYQLLNIKSDNTEPSYAALPFLAAKWYDITIHFRSYSTPTTKGNGTYYWVTSWRQVTPGSTKLMSSVVFKSDVDITFTINPKDDVHAFYWYGITAGSMINVTNYMNCSLSLDTRTGGGDYRDSAQLLGCGYGYFIKNYGNFNVNMTSPSTSSYPQRMCVYPIMAHYLLYGCYNSGNVNVYLAAATVPTTGNNLMVASMITYTGGGGICASTNVGKLYASANYSNASAAGGFGGCPYGGGLSSSFMYLADVDSGAPYLITSYPETSDGSTCTYIACYSSSASYALIGGGATSAGTRTSYAFGKISGLNKVSSSQIKQLAFTPIMKDMPCVEDTSDTVYSLFDTIEPAGIDISTKTSDYLSYDAKTIDNAITLVDDGTNAVGYKYNAQESILTGTGITLSGFKLINYANSTISSDKTISIGFKPSLTSVKYKLWLRLI